MRIFLWNKRFSLN